MSTPYSSNYDVSVSFSDESAQLNVTSGGGVLTYTVPGTSSDLYSVRFGYSGNANVFVRINADPAAPSAAATTLPFCELNPGMDGSQRYVKGGDTIRFATPDTSAYASISLRKLN